MVYHTINFTGQVKWDTHHKFKQQVFAIDVSQQLKLETIKIHASTVILLQNSLVIQPYFQLHGIYLQWKSYLYTLQIIYFSPVANLERREAPAQSYQHCIEASSSAGSGSVRKLNPETSKAMDTRDLRAASTHSSQSGSLANILSSQNLFL